MCQVLEATPRCPSPASGREERKEGRESRRQELQERRQVEKVPRNVDNHTHTVAWSGKSKTGLPGSMLPGKLEKCVLPKRFENITGYYREWVKSMEGLSQRLLKNKIK